MMRKLLAVVAMLAVASAPLFFMGKAESDELQGAPTIVTPSFTNAFILATGAATDTITSGMADSTDYMITKGFERLYLYIKPDRPCRLAIQIRSHGISDTAHFSTTDTSATFAWPWTSQTSTAVRGDSAGWTENNYAQVQIPGEDEYAMSWTSTAATSMKWGGPRGRVIPIRKVDTGEWYWGAVTSIRIRVVYDHAGPVQTVKYVAAVRGVPWGGY